MTFVDTGGWFAMLVPNDEDHIEANKWFANNRQPLLTTNYVIDETLTLLRSRGQSQRAIEAGKGFFNGVYAIVYRLTEEDERAAWEIFQSHSDKEWSFTDCTSKVVMEKIGISTAFAFDRHFRQFGTIQVVP